MIRQVYLSFDHVFIFVQIVFRKHICRNKTFSLYFYIVCFLNLLAKLECTLNHDYDCKQNACLYFTLMLDKVIECFEKIIVVKM